jgi:transposase-like protein
MCYNIITCPRCSSRNIIKNGKKPNKKQNYLCKDCKRQFIIRYTYKGCDRTKTELIIPMIINGSGIRDISRVLKISPFKIIKTIKEYAKNLPESLSDIQVDIK